MTLLPDALICRSRVWPKGNARGGRPRAGTRYTKDSLTREFRVVRTAGFGPSETRKMLDFRRSGAVEAISGGAGAEALSHAMGNTLAASNALFKTYARERGNDGAERRSPQPRSVEAARKERMRGKSRNSVQKQPGKLSERNV
jgi:hypothetical protein